MSKGRGQGDNLHRRTVVTCQKMRMQSYSGVLTANFPFCRGWLACIDDFAGG